MTLNSRQAAFAHAIAGGASGVAAYVESYPGVTREAARSAAARLAKRPAVREEITQLREIVRQNALLSFAEKRAFLATAIRMPINAIDEDSIFIQEKTTLVGKNGERIVRLKTIDKLRAIEIDNRMAGHNVTDQNYNATNSFHYILQLSKMEGDEPKEYQKPALEMATVMPIK